MSLFMTNHSAERIKILGRWSSDAFLAYIRPQVLEWTNTMAGDMTKVKSFMDLNHNSGRKRATSGDYRGDPGSTPGPPQKRRH